MANIHTHPLLDHAFPEAGPPWDANVLPVPRPPRTPPSPQQRPVPVHLYARGIGPHNAMFPPVNTANDRRPDGHWEDMPLAAENVAVRGQRQDLGYNDIDYDIAHYHPQPPADFAASLEYHDRGINYARVAQGVAARLEALATAPIDIFHNAGLDNPADPAQAFLDEWPHQMGDANEPAREVLRRLANRYLNEPDSQVDMVQVRMEPGRAGGMRVVIALKLADLL